MSRAVKAGEIWTTFVFDGIDCADLGVYAITNSSTYTTNLEANFSDNVTSVTAYDGQYYYGTQITGQTFTLNMFAEDLTYEELSKLKAWLNPRHIGKIIFSDQPFKFYYVKPTTVSNLDTLPLTNIQTSVQSILGDSLNGETVYTGKFSITFSTIGSAYGYGLCYFRDDLIYDALNHYGAGVYSENYYYNSGLLYKDMAPRMKWELNNDVSNFEIPMYNPGDAKSYPKFILNLSNTIPSGGTIQFTNKTTGDSCVVDLHGLSGDVTIDFVEQSVSTSQMSYYGRIIGNVISLNNKSSLIEIPETFVENIEDFYLTDYDTIYISHSDGNCFVTINPLAFKVSSNLIGQYFCINKNGGSKIIGVDVDNNKLQLDTTYMTYDIPAAIVEKGIVVTPGGFPCNFIDNTSSIPKSGKLGDVCVVNDIWYMYINDEWEVTNLFTNKNEFKDISGNYITKYLVFGANIVDLDNLIITTKNIGKCTINAELLPRYL